MVKNNRIQLHPYMIEKIKAFTKDLREKSGYDSISQKDASKKLANIINWNIIRIKKDNVNKKRKKDRRVQFEIKI